MPQIKSNRPFLAVRTIITNEAGKVLILKRAHSIQGKGKWCLPGGNIEYGQTVAEAVDLEVHEETSLKARDVQFLFYLENLPSQESELHYINLVFKCRTEGTIHLNHESSEYAWIYQNDLDNYNFAFKNDLALRQYWYPGT